jgi:hypothetical protein
MLLIVTSPKSPDTQITECGGAAAIAAARSSPAAACLVQFGSGGTTGVVAQVGVFTVTERAGDPFPAAS